MKPNIVKRGDKFNRWTIIREVEQQWKHRMFQCKCSCGTTKVITLQSLKRGASKSCGCLLKETTTKHGMWKSPEYNTWAKIKQRCHNPKDRAWHNYGRRGIKVCKEWRRSFEVFFAYVGKRPSANHSLDRYPNNDGNYEPGNVRWATASEQRLNKRPNAPERILLLLAGSKAKEVADMIARHESDESVARHIARYWAPQEVAA